MQVKTSELTGPALDKVVATLEGRPFSALPSSRLYFAPSQKWVHGGPIIEREDIALFPACYISDKFWCASHDKGGSQPFTLHDLDGRAAWWFEENEVVAGPTPLVAAMRCYVASKLGATVEVPDAL